MNRLQRQNDLRTPLRRICLWTTIFGLALPALADDGGAIVSRLWRQYETEKKAGGPTFLPDFSYAGYHGGEKAIAPTGKIFNVKDFGAVPDDDGDDADAIATTVKAAEANGGGIVFLPRGRYLVNTTMEKRTTIHIRSSNIVLRGEGAGKGGTVIFSVQPYGGNFDPHDPNRLHLGDNLFYFHSAIEEKSLNNRSTLCRVTADAGRETFSLTVDDPTGLKAGAQVLLYAKNPDIFKALLAPYEIDPKWTTITKNGAYTVEIHRIKAIDGKRVTFAEPIRYDISHRDGWELRDFQPIREIGVEDICFMGNAYHRYKHHRSDYDDSGWSFIKMKGVTDSWVRRCTFINCSQTLYVSLSSYVSLLNIIVAGNKGHHIPRSVFFNYGLFGGLILDRADYDHGPSVSWGSVGTVFWRCRSMGAIDSHSGRPYVSLFDNVAGGVISSSGGLRDYPQHLRYLVIWNYENLATKTVEYDFWVKGKNNMFVKPIVTGFHGTPARFNEANLEVLESPGRPVKPESLFEAQLQLRLGRTPEWLTDARREYTAFTAQELPPYFDRDRPDSPLYLYREKFNVAALLRYLANLSLEMNRSRQFSWACTDTALTLEADQGLIRNTLYSLMICIYQQVKDGNRIEAEKRGTNVAFILTPGKNGLTRKILEADPDFKYAKVYAARAGGKIALTGTDRIGRLELIMPLH